MIDPSLYAALCNQQVQVQRIDEAKKAASMTAYSQDAYAVVGELYFSNSAVSGAGIGYTSAPTPDVLYKKDWIERKSIYDQNRADIQNKILYLVNEAQQDGRYVSENSKRDVNAFLSQISFIIKPSIFLLDNGNFRIVWRNSLKEQAALQFRGDDIVQCVFFSESNHPRLKFRREATVDTISAVRERVRDFSQLINFGV